MAFTFTIACPCMCGQAVAAADEGFSATVCAVEPCTKIRAGSPAVSGYSIRKSQAFDLALSPYGEGVMRHRDGLVAIA